MNLRISWKSLFYNNLMPALSRLDASEADSRLERIGCLVQELWWPRRFTVDRAITRARQAVNLPEEAAPAFRKALGTMTARMLARDYLFEGLNDRALDERFLTTGFENILNVLSNGRGVIFLGSHLGAYIPALHWMFRQDLPIRTMIQRPRHISQYLKTELERPSPLYPSSCLFLHRDFSPRDATERILRARGVLREGMALYLCGDITTPHGTEVSWFGHKARLLDHWTHLAASTGASVVPVFATFQPKGKYRIDFEIPFRVRPSETSKALEHYLELLQDRVANDPSQAVPYWTWPGYELPSIPSIRSEDTKISGQDSRLWPEPKSHAIQPPKIQKNLPLHQLT